MKSHIILEPITGMLFLMDEQGQVQTFSLNPGLLISLQGLDLNIAPLGPVSPDLLLRTTILDPQQAHFNVIFDANAQVLSIVLTPMFPSTSTAAMAGGGKMKLGSVDLTLSKNTLMTMTANLGASEDAAPQGLANPASQLEWLLLDLKQFNLVVELEGGQLRLSTIALGQENLA